jgi:glycosyltransferase involved in cell wall biosynthesis
MRVLTVLTYYQPHWTGLTRIATTVAEGLARRGHGVTVVTVRHHPDLPADAVENGVRVVRLRPIARMSRGMIAPTLPLAVARLARTHDVVQIHTPLMEAQLVAAICRRLSRPLLMTHQGDLVMPSGIWNQMIERIGTSLLSGAARGATAVSTLSRDYAESSDFLRPFAEKLRAIHPPLDLPRPDRAAAAAWRRELGLESASLVGFAGRFVEEKGFDYLLEAIPELAARVPDVHLVYAGDENVAYEDFFGRCRPLVDRHRGRLTFVGLLSDRQQLANFYAMCDVFALPSRSDCFGLVQLEAMVSGTPVVATDIPGAREAVHATGMGVLVSPRDPTALAAGLGDALGQRDVYAAAHERAVARYDPDRSLEAYERLLEALAAT